MMLNRPHTAPYRFIEVEKVLAVSMKKISGRIRAWQESTSGYLKGSLNSSSVDTLAAEESRSIASRRAGKTF